MSNVNTTPNTSHKDSPMTSTKTQTPANPVNTVTPSNSDSPPAATSTEAAKPKFSKDELLTIFDEIIFSGEYEETVTVRSKLKVTFRARSAEDTTAISREIDGKNFSLISTLQEHRSLLNLVYSLITYSGRDLKTMSIEDRTKFLNKLPAVMVGALSKALVDFDIKISAACTEGEANF